MKTAQIRIWLLMDDRVKRDEGCLTGALVLQIADTILSGLFGVHNNSVPMPAQSGYHSGLVLLLLRRAELVHHASHAREDALHLRYCLALLSIFRRFALLSLGFDQLIASFYDLFVQLSRFLSSTSALAVKAVEGDSLRLHLLVGRLGLLADIGATVFEAFHLSLEAIDLSLRALNLRLQRVDCFLVCA